MCMSPSVNILHYSVPGQFSWRARAVDIGDARDLAAEVANRTGFLAVVLVHRAVDGAEVIELAEIVQPFSSNGG